MTRRIERGGWALIGGKWWGVCDRCGRLVRIDKPILGSLHWCVPDR